MTQNNEQSICIEKFNIKSILLDVEQCNTREVFTIAGYIIDVKLNASDSFLEVIYMDIGDGIIQALILYVFKSELIDQSQTSIAFPLPDTSRQELFLRIVRFENVLLIFNIAKVEQNESIEKVF